MSGPLAGALRSARQAQELSQSEAANRAHVSERTWRQAETGAKPLRNDYLARMCQAVGIKADSIEDLGETNLATQIRNMAYLEASLGDVIDPDMVHKTIVKTPPKKLAAVIRLLWGAPEEGTDAMVELINKTIKEPGETNRDG